MDISPRLAPGRAIVQGYGGGGFRIAGVRHVGAILVWGESVAPWPVAALSGAGLDSLAPILSSTPPVELILLGCGARVAPVGAALRRELSRRGVGVEAMDTGAACRTFNVLTGEDRRVAAALLPVE